MAELSRRDEALVMPIVAEIAKEPGLPVRDLGVLIGKKMSTTLRVVQRLVDAGVLERRKENRVRGDGREQVYSGLWLAPGRSVEDAGAPMLGNSEEVDGVQRSEKPDVADDLWDSSVLETLRTSTLTKMASNWTQQRIALRELGERLGWGRLALTQGETRGGAFLPGRAISGGIEAWQLALEELSDEDVDAALSAGRRLLALLAGTVAR
jgi:hypothetical protein